MAMAHSGSQNERDFMARNSNYRDVYGGMDARSGQFKQSSASSNGGRKDNMMNAIGRSAAETD